MRKQQKELDKTTALKELADARAVQFASKFSESERYKADLVQLEANLEVSALNTGDLTFFPPLGGCLAQSQGFFRLASSSTPMSDHAQPLPGDALACCMPS